MNRRIANITTKGVPCQWVATVDFEIAEKSFFKINQAATPLDPIEERILRSRMSAYSISSRAIMHGGTGTKYWKNFSADKIAEIEVLSKNIYEDLFEPPIGNMPIKTIDLPIAGRGYNALPFVFDLINLANGQKIPDSTQKRPKDENLPEDVNGEDTVTFLRNVKQRLEWITGAHSQSLGLHPAYYTYSRAGAFQPMLFLAMSSFVESIKKENKLKQFRSIRSKLEDFLFEHKELVSEIGHKFGSGSRSIDKIVSYYNRLMQLLLLNKSDDEIFSSLSTDEEFLFLLPLIKRSSPAGSVGKAFSRGVKSGSFLTQAVTGGVRCGICGALVHKNSLNTDHKNRVRDRGSNAIENAGPTHFWCNSDKQ
jgi:hypothetical protein